MSDNTEKLDCKCCRREFKDIKTEEIVGDILNDLIYSIVLHI
jgi:hypothetical protein